MWLCPTYILRSLGSLADEQNLSGEHLTEEGGSLLGCAFTTNIKTISQSPVATLTLHKIYQHGHCFRLLNSLKCCLSPNWYFSLL